MFAGHAVTVALKACKSIDATKGDRHVCFFSEASDNVHEAQGVGEMLMVMGDVVVANTDKIVKKIKRSLCVTSQPWLSVR